MIHLQEEEALIAAHRKEIEDTMEIVREVSYYSSFSYASNQRSELTFIVSHTNFWKQQLY